MSTERKVQWPGWETVEIIGRGSFGEVYRIRRDVLGNVEEAALKAISIPRDDADLEASYAGYDDESLSETFRDHLKGIVTEYSIMRQFADCTNIVSCDDVRYIPHEDGIGWDIFIKMELLTPLIKVLPAQIPEETVVKVAKDLCAALIACKRFNIVHRDIKPQNIFISSAGIYKLGDFGIAKTVEKTMGGTMIGTYQYMAPEVYNHEPYNETADIYSLGLVLYWMLNERRGPFLPLPPVKLNAEMENQAQKSRFEGKTMPLPAHGSERLKKIVLKACAYDPKDRYQSAAEMLEALRAYTNKKNEPEEEEESEIKKTEEPTNTGEVTKITTYEDKTDPNDKRKKWLIALVGGIAAVLLLVIGFFNIHFWTAPSCTLPSECRLCGKIRLSALGHQWNPATCLEPKVCRVCGKAEGNAKGHDWQDATCLEPKVCRVCGKAEGNAKGHDWQDATYQQPVTCAVCNCTDGRSLAFPLIYSEFLEDSNETYSQTDVHTGDFMDAYGVYHNNALRFWVAESPNWADTEYIEYNLDSAYEVLEFTIAASTESHRDGKTKIRIYADNLLVYESEWIGNTTIPVQGFLEVSNVKKLRIECTTDSQVFCYCIFDADLYVQG